VTAAELVLPVRSATQNFGVLRQWWSYGQTLKVREVLAEIWQFEQWTELGYQSFRQACQDMLGEEFPRLVVTERREAVAELTGRGMSTRDIAASLGVSHPTVINDQKASGGKDLPPEVRGADGKTYTRNPITEEMREAADDVMPADPYEGWSKQEREALETFNATGRSIVVSMAAGAVLGPRLWAWAETNGVAERIDRRTRWGNPFEIPDDGHRDTVIGAYTTHYLPHKPSLLAALPDLRGKILGCWCAPLPCHGDILIQEAYA
jgi:hypothetical protein